MFNTKQYENSEIVVLSRKSWVSYIYLIAILLVLFIIFLSTGYFLLIIPILLIIYKILWLYSIMLYMDDNGVWVFLGVFPWQRGFYGVKWVDLDEALFYPNLTSWALRSYTINLKHRFTKNSEISLTHMARGDVAVQLINERHFGMINN